MMAQNHLAGLYISFKNSQFCLHSDHSDSDSYSDRDSDSDGDRYSGWL